MNDQENGAAITLPAASVTPLTVAVYSVEADSGELGVRVAVWLAVGVADRRGLPCCCSSP